MGHHFGFGDQYATSGTDCDNLTSIMSDQNWDQANRGISEDDICLYKKMYCWNPSTGVDDYNTNTDLVNTFPNPSSDKISLDLGDIEFADLVFYDILGNIVMSIPNYINKSEIDISSLSIGTYIIQIQTNTGSLSQKLVLNR